jgi:tetratricopeptide (TPR) repeat protein
MQLGSLSGSLVRLWPSDNDPYWFFSLSHLIDILNEALLVAPVAVPALIYLSLRRGRQKALPENRFLGVVALFAFLFAFWVNPHLGAARDWDLLSLFGFPLTFWAGARIAEISSLSDENPWTLLLPIVTASVCLIPNLVEKNDPVVAAERLDQILWKVSHYQTDSRQAERSLMWAFTLERNVGRPKLALKHLHKRIEAAPDDFQALRGLGEVMFADLNQPDSGIYYLKQATSAAPQQADLWRKLAEMELDQGRYEDALTNARRAVRLSPDDINMHTQLAIVHLRLGNKREALNSLLSAYRLAPQSCEQAINLGAMYTQMGIHDSAYHYLSTGLQLRCRPELVRTGLKSIFQSSVALGRIPQARHALKMLEEIGLSEAELGEMRRELQESLQKKE